MSAKELMIFMPSEINSSELLGRITDRFSLQVDTLPLGFSFEFSAQSQGKAPYLLIEFDRHPQSVIEELMNWERPAIDYRRILSKCQYCITLHYRIRDVANDCLLLINNFVGDLAQECIVENGFGCLLRLSDIAYQLTFDSTWSFEKDKFPEVNGVAISEWLDEGGISQL